MSEQISDALPGETQDLDHDVQTQYQNKSHISLDSTSQRLEPIKNSLKDIPEVNKALIEHFKSEIDLGHYQIDNEIIAENMLHVEPV